MVEIKLNFTNAKEALNTSQKLADMLCFLSGYKECLDDNDDYTNKLDFIFQNIDIMKEVNSKILDGIKLNAEER